MASYQSPELKAASELTVYVCGACGFKGTLPEVTTHSQQCTHHTSTPPDHSIPAIDNSAGDCDVPSLETSPEYLRSQGGQQPSTGSGASQTSTSTIEAQATQTALAPHDETDRAMLMWTSELVNVLVERFVLAMKEAGNTAQKKKVYEQVAEEVHARTGVAVTGEQVGNKIKFMRKQHMALKALMMANKPVPANKMSHHFKALDEFFCQDASTAPLSRALEKCLGGKVKVINSLKGQQSSPIVVVQQQQPTDEKSTLGSAFSQYIAKLIDELSDDQKDEVQAYIISYIFSLKQQNRSAAATGSSG